MECNSSLPRVIEEGKLCVCVCVLFDPKVTGSSALHAQPIRTVLCCDDQDVERAAPLPLPSPGGFDGFDITHQVLSEADAKYLEKSHSKSSHIRFSHVRVKHD